jgi:hypothetical protein
MSQRSEFVRLASARGANVSALCRRFGVSRQSGNKWLRRFASGGEAALADLPRRPLACPHRTAEGVERLVLRERDAHPTWGGRLEAAFARYGMPWEVLCDNGPPFGGEGPHGLTPLAVWLLRLGVGVVHGRRYHPQTQGKDERFHRTLNADVIAGRAFLDGADAQRRFDPFRHEYNFHRPHEALGMAVPADRWRPSPRQYPGRPPPVEYAPGEPVRKVQGKGEISFAGRLFPVARCLAGLPVALRPAPDDGGDYRDGLFAVFFCSHEVARIDLRAPAE